jgi:cell division transport system permease protein
MRIKTVVQEALRSITASTSTTIAATLTVLVGMFVLGLAIALGTWAASWSNHIKQQLVVKVFFVPDATAPEVNSVRAKLASRPDLVKSISYVSPAEGLKQVKKLYPAYSKVELPYNPLGPAYRVQPRKGEDVESIAGLLKPKPKGVDNVTYGKKTAKRVLNVAKVIEAVFIVGVVILLVTSVLLIGNTIRLSIFSRRREIEVMKLVGATNWFVRGPFMVEGLICGLIGSVAAVLLLLLGRVLVLPAIFHHIEDSSQVHAWPLEITALIILAVGLLLGAAGSGLTLRRFLQV